jgi:hypothetical protein
MEMRKEQARLEGISTGERPLQFQISAALRLSGLRRPWGHDGVQLQFHQGLAPASHRADQLLQFFDSRPGEVFYEMQLEVLFEDEYFHSITTKALAELRTSLRIGSSLEYSKMSAIFVSTSTSRTGTGRGKLRR